MPTQMSALTTASAWRQEEHPRDHGAQGAQGVGQHVQEGAAQVDVGAAGTVEDRARGQVAQEADDRDHDHLFGLDVVRGEIAAVGLAQDDSGDEDQGHAVDERGQDLHALVAEGPLGVGRLAPHPGREKAQPQGRQVEAHMQGVRDEGQAPGPPAADELDYEEDRGDGQGPAQGEYRRMMVMVVVVVVAHMFRVFCRAIS